MEMLKSSLNPSQPQEVARPPAAIAAGQQLGFGAFCGLVSGYAVRQGAKVAGVALGTGFVFIQGLAYLGYVNVNWRRVERVYYDVLDADNDGKITAKDFSILFNNTTELLKFEFPAGAGFSGAFAYGLTKNKRMTLLAPVLYGAGMTYAAGGVPLDLGLNEKFGFSAASEWLKTRPFRSDKAESIRRYLESKSYSELCQMEKEVRGNYVSDPMLELLGYTEDDANFVHLVIEDLKTSKKPWYYS